MPAILTPNPDEIEAQLEALEFNKYLLAKSFFDCREFDRCTAVFLPDSLLSSILSPKGEDLPLSSHTRTKEPMHASAYGSSSKSHSLPQMSQKSLFLALYAKMLSGEKRKDEDSEMVMGPQDLGSVTNKQLPIVSRYLKAWFAGRQASPDELAVEGSQGWLEYLYVPMAAFHLVLASLTKGVGTAWSWPRRRTRTKLCRGSCEVYTSSP